MKRKYYLAYGSNLDVDQMLRRCPEAVPEDCLLIRIEAESENVRRIQASPVGAFREGLLFLILLI